MSEERVLSTTATNRRLAKIRKLKIDKDSVISRDLMQDWIRLVIIPTCRAYGVTVLSVATCPSSRKDFHVHAEIVPPVHAELAWRFQFLLGDDGRRVSLNRARWRAGFSRWNKLFEPVGTKCRPICRSAKLCNEESNMSIFPEKYTLTVTEDMHKRLEEERKRRVPHSVPETIRMILSEYLSHATNVQNEK